MSDGPHRSLPMRRHWRDLAERASTPAFSANEVGEAFPIALKRDFREAPLERVRDILGGGEQSSLFASDRAAQLEESRRFCRGSAAGGTLIDCAIEANAKGLTGDAAFRIALENALDAHARAGCHSIEEHYLREDRPNSVNVRNRLGDARRFCPYAELATELMSSSTARVRDLRLPKRTGVDEGPPL
jgi:hypothetical protein